MMKFEDNTEEQKLKICENCSVDHKRINTKRTKANVWSIFKHVL